MYGAGMKGGTGATPLFGTPLAARLDVLCTRPLLAPLGGSLPSQESLREGWKRRPQGAALLRRGLAQGTRFMQLLRGQYGPVRSLLTVTHFLGRTAAKSWVSPKTGAPAPPPPRPPSLNGVTLKDVWTDIPPVRHWKFKSKNRRANALSTKILDRVIDMSTDPGDLVIDSFGGSGTTFVVCESKHRHWIGSEIDFAEDIVHRLEGDGIPPAQEW